MVLNNPPSSLAPEDRLPDGMKRCDVCSKPMAASARTCPHCGKTYTTAGGIIVAIVIGLIIAGGVFIAR